MSSVHEREYRLERWEYYSPLSRTFSLTIAAVLILVLVVGAVGNILVLALFTKYKSLRTSSNVFVVNQAVADLLMCVLCLPVLIANSLRGYYDPDSEYILCNIDASIAGLTGFVSIWSLVAVAFDRFIVIKKGLPTIHSVDKPVTYSLLLGIWTFSIIGATMPFLGFGRYVMEGSNMSCTFDYFTQSYINIAYNVFIEVCFFGLPAVCFIFFYVSIFINVRTHERRYFAERKCESLSETSLRRLQRSRNFKRNELKTAKAAVILISTFCLSWMPYSILSMVALYGNNRGITPIVVTIPVIFAKVSTILNPVLYALVHKRFKSKLIMFIRQYFSASGNINDSTDRQVPIQHQYNIVKQDSIKHPIRNYKRNTLDTEA